MNIHPKNWLPRRRALAAALLYLPLSAGIAAEADNWPQFRGPGARGQIDTEASELPVRWSNTENVRWERELAGRGWSSPVTWGDRVFLTAVVQEGETEPAKKGLYFGGNRPSPPQSEHRWVVYCVDRRTGELHWRAEPHRGPPRSARHLKNSYASETPVVDAERLYAYFGNLGLFCYSHDGDLIWSKSMPPRPTRHGWGTAASPALHEGRLYVVNDSEQDSSLQAIDARTGREIWRVSRDEKSNWSTPFVWQNEIRTEIITPGSGKVRAYDLGGRQLYEFGGCSSITIATPYAAFGQLYVSSGYILDTKKPIFAVRPGAAGDISLAPHETENDFIVWCQKQAAPYNPSTVVHGDLLYVLLDRGFLACYDARDGELVYRRKRLPRGGAFTASPFAYGGNIFCLNEDGVTFVVRAGREFKLLRTNPLGEDEMCLATPAIAGNTLLIRTENRLVCIGKEPAQSTLECR